MLTTVQNGAVPGRDLAEPLADLEHAEWAEAAVGINEDNVVAFAAGQAAQRELQCKLGLSRAAGTVELEKVGGVDSTTQEGVQLIGERREDGGGVGGGGALEGLQ